MNKAQVVFQAYILPIYETELTNVKEKALDEERNDVTVLVGITCPRTASDSTVPLVEYDMPVKLRW